MSLVLEALRRVEKPESRAGSVGVAVASYRPSRKRRFAVAPLLLGLVAGAVLVFLLTPSPRRAGGNLSAESVDARLPAASGALPAPAREPIPPSVPSDSAASESPLRSTTLPPPQEPVGAERTTSTRAAVIPTRRAPAATLAPLPTPSLVLQAVSERDSYPIAIISDQLVKEGDLIGRARVLTIGPDSVEVLLPNGRTETVRFAPPPPEPSPTADPR